MRPVVSKQEELVDWIGQNPKSSEVRAVVRAINEKIVICGPLSKRDLIKYLSSLTNEDSQNLLLELFEGFVYIESSNPLSLEDGELKGLKGANFQDVALSDELHSAVKRHSDAMLVGESREEGFERIFGHFLPGASTVEIVDRFLAEKAAVNEEVVTWLLRKVASYTGCPIRIKSAFPRNNAKDTVRLTVRERIQTLSSALAQQKEKLEIPNDIHLDLYEKVPHNRYIRVQFSAGAIYCSIDHGIDAFKDDPIAEPEPITEISRETFANISKSVIWVPNRQDELTPLRDIENLNRNRISIRLPRRMAKVFP
jgi:hypothetical protein